MNAGQSDGPLQPQTLDGRQIEPLLLPVQSTHGAIEPQVVGELPDVHDPPLVQQKPAPQAPASQLAVQLPPEHVGVAPEHAPHADPPLPHADGLLPATQTLPSQHPP